MNRKRLLRCAARPWRVGRKVGRTIYAIVGDEPSEHDPLIGVMDTRELAEAAVRAHNADLRRSAAATIRSAQS